MARIEGTDRGGSPLARLAFWVSRRRYGKVLGPLKLYARHSAVLYGTGQMDIALRRARRVPVNLRELAVLRVATRIGCPF